MSSTSVKSVIKNVTEQIFKTDTTSNFNLIKHFHPTHTLVTCPSLLWHLKNLSVRKQIAFYSKEVTTRAKSWAFALDSGDKAKPRGQDKGTKT